MKSLMLSCALLLPAFAQTGPAGHWEGNIQLPDRELQLQLDIARSDKGEWAGTLAQPAQNMRQLPLADIKVDGNNLKFRLAAGGANAPDFDCTVESATAMNCTLSGQGGSVSGPFKRTGEAKVDLPKASPAVSKELEGDWEGSLDTPNGSFKIIVHFRNQADQTVKGTLDSPDQNAVGLPLTEITQKELAVEFKLPMVGGAYKGALNKELTQLAGDWSQGPNSLPLTLKKAAAR